jgi:hypothetical protein
VTARVPLVAAGDVITVQPADYHVGYGAVSGTLRMRVIHVTGDTRYAEGLTWVRLMGVTLGPHGRERKQVTASIRVSALQACPPQRPAAGAPR